MQGSDISFCFLHVPVKKGGEMLALQEQSAMCPVGMEVRVSHHLGSSIDLFKCPVVVKLLCM